MFTYEIAPFYNLIEEVVLEKMKNIIGWTEPSDGLFNPGFFYSKLCIAIYFLVKFYLDYRAKGGSISNLYAVQVAKHHFFPQSKHNGLFNLPKLVMFASEHVLKLLFILFYFIFKGF
jgi:glutamate decarboxylase